MQAMCGRYTLRVPFREIVEGLSILRVGELFAGAGPRFNVAPTQTVAAVRVVGGERELVGLRWGLIPPWAKDASIGSRMINARAETLREKPSYRGPLASRRCVLPADGFYEWATEGKRKVPHHFHLRDGGLFAFAGLWDRWVGPEGATLESCTLITTTPNALVSPVHDRMPAMLDRAGVDAWLDSGAVAEQVVASLRPYPAELMAESVASTKVNSPASEGPELLIGGA